MTANEPQHPAMVAGTGHMGNVGKAESIKNQGLSLMTVRLKVLLYGMAGLMLSLQTEAATRVTLVNTCGGEASKNVLALTEAQLSQNRDVTLVERAQVERVLKEQKLWLAGLVDGGMATAAGRLLGVEIFAMLEVLPGSKDVLGVVVFDAGSGVKLVDSTLTVGNAEETGTNIVAAVLAACAKRQQGKSAMRTVCLLSVRNADLPRELDGFCESIGRLLERRLLGGTDLAVLERKRLEQVNREYELPTTGPVADLMPSLIMMQLELSRAGAGQSVQATVLLSSVAGVVSQRVSVVCEQRDAAAITEKLVPELTKVLHARLLETQWDHVREAARFSEEANFLAGDNNFEGAHQMAEAAAALDPANAKMQTVLAGCLLGRAMDLIFPNIPMPFAGSLKVNPDDMKRSLELAAHAQRLRQALRTEHKVPAESREYAWFTHHPFFEPFTCYLQYAMSVVEGQDKESCAQLAALQEQIREFELNMVDPEGVAIQRVRDFRRFGEQVSELLRWRLKYICPSDERRMETAVELGSRWAKGAEKFGPGQFLGNNSAFSLPATYMVLNLYDPDGKKHWTESEIASCRRLFSCWAEHTNALFQVYGRAGQLAMVVGPQSRDAADVRERYAAVMQVVRRILTAPPCPLDPEYREAIYQGALFSITLLPTLEMQHARCQELFDFMVQQRELDGGVAAAACSPRFESIDSRILPHPRPVSVPSAEEKQQALKNIDQVLALLDSPGYKNRGGDQRIGCDTLKRQFLEKRTAVLGIVPHPSELRLLYKATNQWSRLLGAKQVMGDAVYTVEQVTRYTIKDGYLRSLRLVRVNLRDDSVALLGETVDCGGDNGSCIVDGFFYLATNDGLVGFPLDGSPPIRLGLADGLPSQAIQSVAGSGDKVYLGMSGYIVRWERKTRQLVTLAASRRTDKQTPLDGTSPSFNIPFTVADPARDRILFAVDFGRIGEHPPLMGLWALNVKTGAFSQVLQLRDPCRWMGPVRGDQLLFETDWTVIHMDNYLVAVELKTDQSRVLYRAPGAVWDPGLHLCLDQQTQMFPGTIASPFVLMNKWLWAGDPFGRIGPDGTAQGFEPPPELYQHYGRKVDSLMTASDSDDCLLIGKRDGLWLMTPPKD